MVKASTDNESPPRQEGEAVVRCSSISPLGQVRDGAGVGGRTREQFNGGEAVGAITIAANYKLAWRKIN